MPSQLTTGKRYDECNQPNYPPTRIDMISFWRPSETCMVTE